MIELHPKKKISATTLPNLLLDRVCAEDRSNENGYESDYERNQGRVYPKNYPVVYYLIAQMPNSYVSAMIENAGLGSMLMGSSRTQSGADDTKRISRQRKYHSTHQPKT